MPGPEFRLGRLQKAPENLIDSAGFSTVVAEAKAGRRDFLRQALTSAGAAAAAVAGSAVPAAALAQANPAPAAGGDPNILNLPAHTTGLGQPVATDGYGKPSKFEANVQRRPSPGLTQTAQSSVSFAPLQSNGTYFGIVAIADARKQVIAKGVADLGSIGWLVTKHPHHLSEGQPAWIAMREAICINGAAESHGARDRRKRWSSSMC